MNIHFTPDEAPDLGVCTTQLADEPAPGEYVDGCEGTAVAVVLAAHCIPTCTGHPVCGFCYDKGKADGRVHTTMYDERSTHSE